MISSYETNADLPVIKTELTTTHTEESIQRLIVASLSQSLNVSPEEISLDIEFFEYGIDSVIMLELVQILEDAFGLSLDLEFLWNYPTPRLVAQYLSNHLSHLE